MSRKVIVTCAITGGGAASLAKHPGLPKTPSEIADSAVEAARAGAAVVHLHVRDPETGAGSNRFELYEELVGKIRESGVDVIINLTGGMDGELALDSVAPIKIGSESTLKSNRDRYLHAIKLRPEISSLDCGTMAFGDRIYVARQSDLREMASLLRDAGVKPELECFDLGHIENAKRLISEGIIEGTPLFQLCLSTGYGAPATPIALQAMRESLPTGAIWAAFGCGADEAPVVAQVVTAGGHVRVGLEDNLYLRRGVLATNAQLVDNAVGIMERMGASVATPNEAREILGLPKPG